MTASLTRAGTAPGAPVPFALRGRGTMVAAMTVKAPRPIVLVILDGYGERAECDDNAVCQA